MSVAGKRRRRGQGRLPPKGFGTGTQGANEKLIPDPRPLAPATFMPRPRRGVAPLPRRPPRAGGRGLSPRRASGQESKAHRSHYLLSDARKASRTLYALRRRVGPHLILSMMRPRRGVAPLQRSAPCRSPLRHRCPSAQLRVPLVPKPSWLPVDTAQGPEPVEGEAACLPCRHRQAPTGSPGVQKPTCG